MPIYEYKCAQCGTKFDAIRPHKDADAPIPCARCAHPETHRAISACFSRSSGTSSTAAVSGGGGGCGGCSGGSCGSCRH